MQIGQISTKRTTRIIICIIFFLSIILNLFPFWTLYIEYDPDWGSHYCAQTDQYSTWIWIVFRVLSLLIPAILVFVFTAFIIIRVKRMSLLRREISTVRQTTTGGGRNKVSDSDQRQLNIMLLLVAITFLILRLPYSIMTYVHELKYGSNHYADFADDMIYDATYCLAVFNYCINFFLFCLSGSVFRKTFFSCLQCEKLNRTLSTRSSRATMYSNASSRASNSTTNVVKNSHPVNQQQTL